MAWIIVVIAIVLIGFGIGLLIKVINKQHRQNNDFTAPFYPKSTMDMPLQNDNFEEMYSGYSINSFNKSNTKNKFSPELISFICSNLHFQNNFWVNENDFLEHLFYECYRQELPGLGMEVLEIIEDESKNYTQLHYIYNYLIDYFYKKREINPNAILLCKTYCLIDLTILPRFFYELDQELPNQRPPRIPSIKRLILIYEKQGLILEAIELCKIAIELNLDDNTQGGFLEKLNKLCKKNTLNYEKTVELGIGYNSKNVKQVFSFKDQPVKKSINYTRVENFVDDYVLIDIETTGLSPINSEIIEVGAIKCINNVEVARFNEYVKPINPIPNYITEINGITNEMVKNADFIETVLPKFLEFIGNNVVVGHNIGFDIRFILENCQLCNISEPNFSAINTLPLSRKYIQTPNHQLKTLKEFLNIDEGSHRAISDCITTNAVYQYCKSQYNVENT